jgi:hypothetical protein
LKKYDFLLLDFCFGCCLTFLNNILTAFCKKKLYRNFQSNFINLFICKHFSDHNYFGVCQGILAPNAFSLDIPQGLLHSIPESVRMKFPLLPRLITECGIPSRPGGRFEAATQLLEILKQI